MEKISSTLRWLNTVTCTPARISKAAISACKSEISITLTAATGAQFVFPVLPVYPTAGGSGVDAQTVSFTFPVARGEVTETFS